MIFGIGTDLVEVDRIDRGLQRFGERYAKKILSDRELDEFHSAGRPSHFLAKRYAAKEAAVKAMGTGFVDGISLRHISVGHDRLGRPLLEFSGRAEELRRELGIGEGHLSLTDETHYALAFVTLMRS